MQRNGLTLLYNSSAVRESSAEFHDLSEEPRLWLRAASLFHKAEIAYVLIMTVIIFRGAVRMERSLIGFTTIWGIACASAAVAALWPRTPRLVHVLAELVLLLAALGQFIGPWHEVFPLLNREIRNAYRWNEIPLTQRRIVVWNILSAFGLIWGVPAAAILAGVAQAARRSVGAAVLGFLGFLLVWGGLGVLFALVIQAFFRG